MYLKVENTFYVLTAMILLGVLFVFHPTDKIEVAQFQTQVKDQFTLAATEVLSGIDYMSGVEIVWDGINDFYNKNFYSSLSILILNIHCKKIVDYSLMRAMRYIISLDYFWM